MTKLDSIPESQLTALMDLILETAADWNKRKGALHRKGKKRSRTMAHQSHLHFNRKGDL